VLVSNGAFSVALGENKALNDSVRENEALHLAIAVRHDAEPFTVLRGTQRLLAVPFAARAAAAKDYRVSGNLQVGNDAVVAGGLSADSLAVRSGAFTVDPVTGRVGIGTATPAEELESNGRVKAPGMWTYAWAATALASSECSSRVTLRNGPIGEGVGNVEVSGQKFFAGTCVSHVPDANYALHHGSLIWKSTAPVSSLTFFPDAGGLKAGTRVIVWGME